MASSRRRGKRPTKNWRLRESASKRLKMAEKRMTNRHRGSSIDDFPKEEGVFEEFQARAGDEGTKKHPSRSRNYRQIHNALKKCSPHRQIMHLASPYRPNLPTLTHQLGPNFHITLPLPRDRRPFLLPLPQTFGTALVPMHPATVNKHDQPALRQNEIRPPRQPRRMKPKRNPPPRQ